MTSTLPKISSIFTKLGRTRITSPLFCYPGYNHKEVKANGVLHSTPLFPLAHPKGSSLGLRLATVGVPCLYDDTALVGLCLIIKR